MVRKRPNPSALPFFLIALKSLNVGANPSTYWSRNSDAQIREQRGNIKRSLPFLAVILCSFGYPQVLEIPDQGALSRQRSRWLIELVMINAVALTYFIFTVTNYTHSPQPLFEMAL
jgi:hypothetical protein